ncbi:MAG: glycosyltransferase family 4 protein [Deltaproteobacteria bacterium]|nr:glycosyltransferase family 4 protein [Deltaproteobacteria bacterium]
MCKKILIICPDLKLPGGIAGYYSSLKNHFSYGIEYFFIGARKRNESNFLKPFNLIRDVLFLFLHLLKSGKKYDLVCLNPSFIPFCIVREGMLLQVIKYFRIKVIVFFRGWSWDFSKIVEKRYFKLFFQTYNKTDSFIALSKEFKNQLRAWGFNQPVFLETTVVDKLLLNGYTIEDRMERIRSSSSSITILFLSRVEKEKGIIEAIDALNILIKSYPKIRMLVAGVGSYLSESIEHCKSLALEKNVNFLGWITGEQKSRVLADSDILLLPTYREGMPNCVLEAMAFGIPVVTRPIGGLKDFFVDGKFGFMTESTEPETIASLVDSIIVNRPLREYMSIQSFNYAHDHFFSGSVTRRLEIIYDKVQFGIRCSLGKI